MSAIALPVYAYQQSDAVDGGLWSVRDTNDVRIGRDLSEDQANQIVLALNKERTKP